MRLIKAAFGVPVAIDNDANMAAIAEGALGAAVGIDDYVVVLISVGIGMGIVMDGACGADGAGARARSGGCRSRSTRPEWMRTHPPISNPSSRAWRCTPA